MTSDTFADKGMMNVWDWAPAKREQTQHYIHHTPAKPDYVYGMAEYLSFLHGQDKPVFTICIIAVKMNCWISQILI